MNRFSLKPDIIFGEDAVAVLETLKEERVMVIADPFIIDSGMIDHVKKHLTGCKIFVFSDVVPDPPMEKIASGIVALNEFNPTVLIACGGGSAIDSAKGIYHYSDSGKRRFIAIPTTSGTGSEVTKFAVFTDTASGQKYPVVSDKMIPDMAIIDVDFVKTVPGKVAADTGFDVLTHAVEAYVSTSTTVITDAMAEKAAALVFTYLKRSCENCDDLEAREKMHEASLLAGIAFNEASLGLNHAIAHNLGGRLHIPHGRINAMLLCPVIWFNANITGYGREQYTKAAVKYAKLAKICGISASTTRQQVRGFMEKIYKLMRDLKMPVNLKQAGIQENQIRKIETEAVRGALADACLKTNPRTVNENQIKEIIHKLSEYERKQ